MLGSCHFGGVWPSRLSCKGGGVPLSAWPKNATTELVGLLSITFLKCRAPSREVMDAIFKVFWYDSKRNVNPRSTDYEADAITTTPSRRYLVVSLHCYLVRPLSYLHLWYLVLWLRYLPCFRHSDKSGHAFADVIHRILVGAHQAKLFANKIFSIN